MPVPATKGQLRTNVYEMSVGDYIKMYQREDSTLVFEDIPSIPEMPLTGQSFGTSARNQFWYMVKIAQGLLAADRVPFHTYSWDAFHSAKFIEGLTTTPGDTVPKLSTNVSAHGEAIASASYSTTFLPWKAFNKTITGTEDCWATPNGTVTGWLGYKYTQAVIVRGYAVTSRNSDNRGNPKSWTFEASNNGQNWVVLDTVTNEENWGMAERREYRISNGTAYLYYRINVSERTQIGIEQYVSIGELELLSSLIRGYIRAPSGGVAYGQPRGLVPTLTSNSGDGVNISVSSVYNNNYAAWRVFTGVSSNADSWQTPSGVKAGYLQVEFTEPKKVKAYSIQAIGSLGYAPLHWTLEGSDDGQAFTVIDKVEGQPAWGSLENRVFELGEEHTYKFYRLNVTQSEVGGTTLGIGEFQLFDNIEATQMSLYDYGLGAWPQTNEWDRFIVNFPKELIQDGKTLDDVFHNVGTHTWVQDTPIVALGASTHRCIRGNTIDGKGFGWYLSSTSNSAVGFRPIFEYKEV
ncbi:discoidin domain-containing protein [Metabacillus fastidiosus]|uniref:discoidin domain-containing protein n=1 Tax=Metabacillus fastidiosus TaxID=1458 RepID=UPI003D2B34BC